MKNTLLVVVKISISSGLIFWLLSRADLHQIWQTIRQADIGLLTIAFFQFFIGYLIVAKRWHGLLVALEVPARILTLIASFSIATFFNHFLPSTIGGDAYRMYASYRMGAGKSRAVAVILIDRVIGLSALLLLAIIASLFASELADSIPFLRLFFVLAVFGMSILVWIIFGNGGKILLDLLAGDHVLLSLPHKIMDKIYAGFHLYQGRSDVMLKALGLSFLLQVNVVIHCLIIAKALDMAVPVGAMFIIIPLAYLIMVLPISINGIGLRESVFVMFFGLYGVAQEQALAFAFISFGMLLGQGVVGGIVFMFRRMRQPSSRTETRRS